MRLLAVGVLGIICVNAQANVIQYFAGLSYNNPSELFKIKENELIFGGTLSFADLQFRGTVFDFNTFNYNSGVNHSSTVTIMPYGRIAKRINKKAVFAVDVTQPFNSNLNWGNDAFTRYANTQNLLIDTDISPKMSLTVTDKLQIGAGVNLNFLSNNEVNWAFPTGPGPLDYANLINKTMGFGIGYNLGLTYIFNQTNFFGLTYYSKIRQNTHGYSLLGDSVNPNLSLNFYLPATTIINYVHIFNPKWLMSLTGFESQWNENQYVRLYNTAAPPVNFVFPMLFKASYAGIVAVRHQCTEKMGITLAGMIDLGPERDNLRTITFPSYTQYFAGVVSDYHFTQHTSIELLYGYVYSHPAIDNTVPTPGGVVPFTTGQVNINVNVFDVKLKIEG